MGTLLCAYVLLSYKLELTLQAGAGKGRGTTKDTLADETTMWLRFGFALGVGVGSLGSLHLLLTYLVRTNQ